MVCLRQVKPILGGIMLKQKALNYLWIVPILFFATSIALPEKAAATEVVSGYHQTYGKYTVFIERYRSATLRWADGYPGFRVFYSTNPNPQPRCPNCDVYEGIFWVGRHQIKRQIVAHYQADDARYYKANYHRMNWPLEIP